MPYLISSVLDVGDYDVITIDEVVRLISSNTYFQKIWEIRQTKCDAERKRLKKKLPAFFLAQFKGGRLTKENLLSSKYIIYDIDGLSKGEIQDVRGKLEDQCLFIFVSPSGNGIKFVIETEHPIPAEDYDHNRRHYFTYFKELLPEKIASKLDDNYNSLQTFMSQDGSCKLHETPVLYPVYSSVAVKEASNVDITTVQTKEIIDVLEYLSEHNLSYHEWTMCSLALKSYIMGLKSDRDKDSVADVWQDMGRRDKARNKDHAHRDWVRKLDGQSPPRATTIATLFWIAKDKGYARKLKYIEDGSGIISPFIQGAKGLYYNRELVFGFKDIGIVRMVADDSGSKTTLSIDGHELTIPSSTLVNPAKFCETVISQMPWHVYMAMPTGQGIVYKKLFKWLYDTKSPMTVRNISGVGMVNPSPRIWNFGNYIVVDGVAFPHEKIVTIKENSGFSLSTNENIRIERSRELLNACSRLFFYFGEWAAMAMGWAAANVLFNQIKGNIMCFPLLFIHGSTASGKTQLAHLILAMFGVASPNGNNGLKVSMENATPKAIQRIMDDGKCMPHMLDEYSGNNSKRASTSQVKQYTLLKSLYDATESHTAKFSNDNRTQSLKVTGGCVVTACIPPKEAEAIERCVYVNLDGVAKMENRNMFHKEFLNNQWTKLSTFGLACVLEYKYDEFEKEYDKAFSELNVSKGNYRPIQNYAIVLASWRLFCRIVGDGCTFPDIPITWWRDQVCSVTGSAKEQEVHKKFLDRCLWSALSQDQRVTWVLYESDRLYVYMSEAYEMIPARYEISLPRLPELREMLKSISPYLGSKTKFMGGLSRRAYCFSVVDGEINYENKQEEQYDIPF